MEFLPETIDLVPFCRNLFNQIQLTDDKQHRFVFDAHGTFDGAEMDERLLQHIFVNLLTNAVKYSPGSSEIRFEMDEVDDRARFRISDQGIGMSEQDVSRLGETFFRAANARRYQGTGLGLAIVKENVAAHKGTFHCDSRLNEGTTFTVELPLRMQPARGTATFVAAIPQPNTL
jgi:signal transduction histidine kinase